MKENNLGDDFVTVQDAAKLRGVSRSRIHQWIQEGRLNKEERYGRTVVSSTEVMKLEKLKLGRPPKPKDEKVSKKRVKKVR